jgi:hypothetical protein
VLRAAAASCELVTFCSFLVFLYSFVRHESWDRVPVVRAYIRACEKGQLAGRGVPET